MVVSPAKSNLWNCAWQSHGCVKDCQYSSRVFLPFRERRPSSKSSLERQWHFHMVTRSASVRGGETESRRGTWLSRRSDDRWLAVCYGAPRRKLREPIDSVWALESAGLFHCGNKSVGQGRALCMFGRVPLTDFEVLSRAVSSERLCGSRAVPA